MISKNNVAQNSKGEKSYTKLITTSQLISWFSQTKILSQSVFPELIKRLIEESTDSIKYIRFPTGDNITTDGVDGELCVEKSTNQFIPDGTSYWEIGATTITPSSKMKSDYDKRTNKISNEQQSTTTIVLVTVKSIKSTTKKEYLEKFEKDGNWKKVIIIDGIDLENWLGMCFSTSLWLYEKFDNIKLNALTIEKAIENIKIETSPEMSLRLYTELRENEIEQLEQQVKRMDVINVSGSSTFESYRFVISAIAKCPDIAKKTVVCNDQQTFIELDNRLKDKIFVLNFSIGGEDIHLNDLNAQIRIFEINTGDKDKCICLNDRDECVLYSVLKEDMFLSDSNIQSIQIEAHNNVKNIVYKLANNKQVFPEKWLNNQNMRLLIPITILGEINLKSNTEMRILQYFLKENMQTDTYVTKLRECWENIDDSPISVYDNKIKITQKKQVWSKCKNLMNGYIDNIFCSFKNIFNISIDKYNNEIIIINNSISEGLDKIREGLLFSLTLLSTFNQKEKIDAFISDILNSLDESQLLHFLPYFRKIAEVSPSVLAKYLYNSITSDDSALNKLSHRELFVSTGYAYLTDTLSKLTFFENTKKMAILCLFLLCTKNYENVIVENANDTLISVLHWLRKNALSYEEKIQIINELIGKYNYKAFFIPLEIARCNGISYSSQTLRWKDATINEIDANNEEICEGLRNVLVNVLKTIDNNDNETILKILKLDDGILSLLVDDIYLCVQKKCINNDHDSYELYRAFQKKRYWYYKWHDNSNHSKYINGIEKIIDMLQPNDLLEQNLIYYDNFDYNGCPNNEIISNDETKEAENVLIFRKERLKKLIKEYGVIKVLSSILKNIQNNYFWGEEFYNLVEDMEINDEVVEISLSNKKYLFCVGFINKLDNYKIDEIFEKISYKDREELSKKFYLNKYIPKMFADKPEIIKNIYKNKKIMLSNDDVNALRKYNPLVYLEGICRAGINTSNIDEIYDVLLTCKIEDLNLNSSVNRYQFLKIFKEIDKNFYDEKIFRISCKYIEYLEYYEIPNSIKTYYFLNPEEYIKVFENKEIKYDLLSRYSYNMTLPENFSLNQKQLKKYIESFMKYSCEYETRMGELKRVLGGVLIRSFKNKNEELLSEELKMIIEEYSDENLNRGIIVGYLNSIGVRNVENGDNEEKKHNELMTQAQSNLISFPECAKILEELANYYHYLAIEDRKFQRIIKNS